MIVACPECGKEISNQANLCPGCGFPRAGALSWGLNLFFIKNIKVAEIYFQNSYDSGVRFFRERICRFCDVASNHKLFKLRPVENEWGPGYGVSISTRCKSCGRVDKDEKIIIIAAINEDFILEWKKQSYNFVSCKLN